MMEIFSLLSPKDLSYVAQVCLRWKLLSEDELFWRKINLTDKKVPVDFIEKALSHGCRSECINQGRL